MADHKKVLSKYTEPLMLGLLVLCFLAMSLWVGITPHSDEQNKGTIPDEWAFYAWAEVYMDGEVTVPLSVVGGTFKTTLTVTNSSEYMIFINASMSDLDGEGHSNDLSILVYDGDGEAVEGATVILDGGKELGETNATGYLTALQVGMGFHSLEAIWLAPNGEKVRASQAVESAGPSGQYDIYGLISTELLFVDDNRVTLRFGVTAYDVFGDAVEGATVIVSEDVLGETDSNGQFEEVVTLPIGDHAIVLDKPATQNVDGLFGSIVSVDGEPAMANHWPPGFSYVLGVFIILGLEGFVGVFIALVMGVSVYIFTRRAFGFPAATFATALVLFSCIAIQMQYSKYMADYASAAFAFGGFTAMSEAFFLVRKGYNKFKNIKQVDEPEDEEIEEYFDAQKARNLSYVMIGGGALLALAGGLLMSSAVTMRYSAVVLGFGAAVYLLIKFCHDNGFEKKREEEEPERKNKPQSGKKWRTILEEEEGPKPLLFAPSKRSWVCFLVIAVPFIVGLLIFGGMLMNYNNELFGGPFNSGYQMGHNVQVTSDENGTSADVPTPEQSFFESYFNVKDEDIENMPRLTTILFHVSPVLFLAPLGVFYIRRDAAVSAMLVWVIAILIIYGTLNWVGQWEDDDTRTMEDMRYFLPAVPGAAVLAGLMLSELWNKNVPLKIVAVVIVLLLMLSGVMCAAYGIQGQLDRLQRDMQKGHTPGPGGGQQQPDGGDGGDVADTKIHILLSDPDAYHDTFVSIQNVRVDSVGFNSFDVVDPNDGATITIRAPQGITMPSVGDIVSVTGRFLPHLERQDEWEIAVDPNRGGSVTVEKAQTRAGDFEVIIFGPREGEKIPPIERFVVGVGIKPDDAEVEYVQISLTVDGQFIETKDANELEPQRYMAEFDLRDHKGKDIVFVVDAQEAGASDKVRTQVSVSVGMTEPGGDRPDAPDAGGQQPPGNQQVDAYDKELFSPEKLGPVRILNGLVIAAVPISLLIGVFLYFYSKQEKKQVKRKKEEYFDDDDHWDDDEDDHYGEPPPRRRSKYQRPPRRARYDDDDTDDFLD